jgi:hypothetical protein
MGAFEACKTVQQVLDLMQSMRDANTLTFNHELLAELRIIEIQSNNQPPPTSSDEESDANEDPLPSTSESTAGHVSLMYFIYFRNNRASWMVEELSCVVTSI